MTPKDSSIRLALYAGISMLTSAVTGLERIDIPDAKSIVIFVLQTVLAGAITARAYIDQTPTQIKP